MQRVPSTLEEVIMSIHRPKHSAWDQHNMNSVRVYIFPLHCLE